MIESSGFPTTGWRPRLRLVSALSGSAIFLLVHLPAAHGQFPDHSSDELHKLNQSVNVLIKKVSPSVVQILVTGYGPLEEGERGSLSEAQEDLRRQQVQQQDVATLDGRQPGTLRA